jgi:hypothetical protein
MIDDTLGGLYELSEFSGSLSSKSCSNQSRNVSFFGDIDVDNYSSASPSFSPNPSPNGRDTPIKSALKQQGRKLSQRSVSFKIEEFVERTPNDLPLFFDKMMDVSNVQSGIGSPRTKNMMDVGGRTDAIIEASRLRIHEQLDSYCDVVVEEPLPLFSPLVQQINWYADLLGSSIVSACTILDITHVNVLLGGKIVTCCFDSIDLGRFDRIGPQEIFNRYFCKIFVYFLRH